MFAVLAWLALLAWASLTFLASAATGSTMAAAGIGFVALVGLSLARRSSRPLDRLLPTGLAAPGCIALGQGLEVDAARLATALGRHRGP